MFNLIMNLKKIKGLIILNNKYGNAHKKIDEKVNRILYEFSLLNVDIDVKNNNGDLIGIIDNKIVSFIGDYSFIIYLDKDKYTSMLLEKYGYKVFNNSSFISLCDDKILTHIELSNLNINMPDIISAPLNFFNDHYESDEAFIKHVVKNLSLPVVFKTAYGSLAEGVSLASTYDEALALYFKNKNKPCFFQRYIEANNKSIRVLIIDKKVVATIERINESDFRSNNVDFKTSSRSIDLDNELKDIVNKLIAKFNIEYAGIDFVKSNDNKYYLLEMNSNAFFAEVEKVSGINAAKIYCIYILKSINAL